MGLHGPTGRVCNNHRMRRGRGLAAVTGVALTAVVLTSTILFTSSATTAAPGDGEGPAPAEQAGGGALPGVKPTQPATGTDGLPIIIADPAPPMNPDFVDDYGRIFRRVEKARTHVKKVVRELVDAREAKAGAASDWGVAVRERGRADQSVAFAASQVDAAVRDMYMTGSTGMGIVIGVLGSTPEDLLRNLDSLAYVEAATGAEAVDFALAQGHQLRTASAASTALMRKVHADDAVDTLATDLKRTRAQLDSDEKELERLIAAAAPQTVVGRSGCPKSVLEGTVPSGVDIRDLCERAVMQATSPQAASAIKWALVRLGAPYACDGIGRMEQWRYDCSSYVSRAYAEAAGMRTATDSWAPSTRDMIPWDGASLDPHYLPIPADALAPGDLVLYDTCPEGQTCPYRHVVMYLGTPYKGGPELMAHTNSCGGVAHVAPFTGTSAANFLGVRRVVTVPGEKLVLTNPQPEAKSGRATRD